MSDWALSIYHYLPPSGRSLAATLRGLYLRHWRFGAETEQLVAKAMEREQWGPEQWKSWQEARLGFILERAFRRVPYYREQWAARRRRGDRASWQYLENWPILEKEALRQNPQAFVADDRDLRRMFHEHTSGTTGKPLNLWRSRDTVRRRYALYEARFRRWHGVSRADRWAILGGQLVTPVNRRRPPFWVWNASLKQLYLSSYHLAPDLIPYYLDAIRQHRIRYIWGYPSSVFALAQEALRLDRHDLKMHVAIANAEPLFDFQRRTISEAFQCPVRETYGMVEMVAAASECQHGRLHLWPEVGVTEILDGNPSASTGKCGELVSTGLLDPDMPLIRYRVGDRVSLPAVETSCECGRALPALSYVEGRSDDVLFTTDGRRIGRLDPVFKADLPVRETQIIQEELDVVRVRYVPAANFTSDAARQIGERLRSRMGEVQVILDAVPQIPREANGKFRAVICRLSAERRESIGLTVPQPASVFNQ